MNHDRGCAPTGALGPIENSVSGGVPSSCAIAGAVPAVLVIYVSVYIIGTPEWWTEWVNRLVPWLPTWTSELGCECCRFSDESGLGRDVALPVHLTPIVQDATHYVGGAAVSLLDEVGVDVQGR